MSIFNHFQHITLTNDQRNAVEKIEAFIHGENDVFILNGYAGSGKTTLIKGIAEYLNSLQKKFFLMAPTGRAAKVLTEKTKINAATIHRSIYSFKDLIEEEISEKENDVTYTYYFKVGNYDQVETIFIVDEASMVSDQYQEQEFIRFGSGKLLQDLIEFSNIQNPQMNSKIVFVGDPAQLPPIEMKFSPALEKKYLEEKWNLIVSVAEMKDVIRQQAGNGILDSATKIRKCLTSGFFNDFNLKENGRDIFNPNYEDLIEIYKKEKGSKVIISYKNKTALDINNRIRFEKHNADVPIQPGDTIIVGGNNYRLGIFNGEFGIVNDAGACSETREIRFNKKDKGVVSVLLTWRKIELIMPDDNGNSRSVNGLMLENYLNGDNKLGSDERRALYVDFKKRNPRLKPKTDEFKETLKTDLYFNCILLKYGYAVTCHKAQGGEWDATFVFWDKGVKEGLNFFDSPHTRSGKANPGFYRWAYTAVTRASQKLFCINPPYFSSFSEMSVIDNNVKKSFEELNGQTIDPAEIVFNDNHLNLLTQFNLQEAPLPIQNHFLKVHHAVNGHYIEIVNWIQDHFEVRYHFQREDDTAAIKFWINKQNEFNPSFQKLPGGTNSNTLYLKIEELLKKNARIVVHRNTIKTVLKKIEFDIQIEEEKPFLKVLFDALFSLLSSSYIEISDVGHHDFRERYYFDRGDEKAVVDFEYNKDGFFGRVLPLDKKCNSDKLLVEITEAVSKIKCGEYVI